MTTKFPKIIQGGMGVYVSGWPLARAVSLLGQQGTVSGVTLERVLAYQLQHGDPGEHIRRSLATFPVQRVVNLVMDNYFVEGGVGEKGFRNAPVFTVNPSALLISMVICANYAFVHLAKEGHQNPVSINYLEKIQMPHIYAITGAMLAGVDFITMGAGIAKDIPEVINCIAAGKTATYKIPVQGRQDTPHVMSFNPVDFFGTSLPKMKKPGFLPIVSSNLLADMFLNRFKLPAGSVYGFVVEEPTAGGHNAPPRKPVYDENGVLLPAYGPRDVVDYAKIAALGLPFWIGGSYASPKGLQRALALGAQGIQAGSIFALCEESGMNPSLRQRLRVLGFNEQLQIRTDMQFSPTGFPFKVACLSGTISSKKVYGKRRRICNHGVLDSLYAKSDGSIGYRCASEPVDAYVAKGGNVKDTEGRACLCNGLLSTVQVNDPDEPPIVTLGDDLSFLKYLPYPPEYTAAEAIKYLLSNT